MRWHRPCICWTIGKPLLKEAPTSIPDCFAHVYVVSEVARMRDRVADTSQRTLSLDRVLGM